VNSNTKLVEFVYQYDKVVAAHRNSESQQDFWGLNSVSNCTSNSYEIQVSKLYTLKIFQLFQACIMDRDLLVFGNRKSCHFSDTRLFQDASIIQNNFMRWIGLDSDLRRIHLYQLFPLLEM